MLIVAYNINISSPLKYSSDGFEIVYTPPIPRGGAIIENLDAGNYTDDNGQSVQMLAPATGTGQNGFTALLNNAVVDHPQFHFLQNGFVFHQNGNGSVVYTSTKWALQPQNYPINYLFLNTYRFILSGSQQSNTWDLCAQDMASAATYHCILDNTAPGNRMKYNINNDIFVENANTNANWYTNFQGRWRAFEATTIRNSFHYPKKRFPLSNAGNSQAYSSRLWQWCLSRHTYQYNEWGYSRQPCFVAAGGISQKKYTT